VNDVNDADEAFWERRYRQINDFERYLTETGTTVVKFFLNVSKEEQRRRLLKRIDEKEKHWKFSAADLKERDLWDDYMDAYSKMLTNTSTEYAPWYVIPADHKWFMRYAVGSIINRRLEELKTSYPKLDKAAEAELAECRKRLEIEG
jgi:polyphosphate kinase 2 (PPK2 family)